MGCDCVCTFSPYPAFSSSPSSVPKGTPCKLPSPPMPSCERTLSSCPGSLVPSTGLLPTSASHHLSAPVFENLSLLTGLEEGGVQLPEAGLPPGLSPPGESLGGHTVDCYFLTGMLCPLPGRLCPLKHRLSGPNRKHMALMSRSGTSWRCSNSMLYPHKEQSLWGRGPDDIIDLLLNQNTKISTGKFLQR